MFSEFHWTFLSHGSKLSSFRNHMVEASNSDFAALCTMLDQYLDEVAGGKKNREGYLSHNKREDLQAVILAYDGLVPVACAGLKYYDDITAEVKRVFVKPEYRQLGIGESLLWQLGNYARKNSFSTLILETGAPLVAAMKLYEKIGYQEIDRYGPYKDLAASICLQKKL